MPNNVIESARHKAFLDYVVAHPEGCTRQQIQEATGIPVGALNFFLGHYNPSKIRVVQPNRREPKIIYPKETINEESVA